MNTNKSGQHVRIMINLSSMFKPYIKIDKLFPMSSKYPLTTTNTRNIQQNL